jgi:hypothetical protein
MLSTNNLFEYGYWIRSPEAVTASRFAYYRQPFYHNENVPHFRKVRDKGKGQSAESAK